MLRSVETIIFIKKIMPMANNNELDGVGKLLREFLSERLPVILSDEQGDYPNGYETLKNTLMTLSKRCYNGFVKGDDAKLCARLVAEKIDTMAQLVYAAYYWDESYEKYLELLKILFAENFIHIEEADKKDWIRKLDEVLEKITNEEYVPHEDEHKRDAHKMLFYLNVYAKVSIADISETKKQELYQQLANTDNRMVVNIVASIYYANPRLCSGYTDFTAVAGGLIAKARERYATYFLTAEKYARHERGCKFQWHSKKKYYYNDMVDWWRDKPQNSQLVGLLAVIWSHVDWEPSHNNFHLKRDKRSGGVEVPTHIKNYIDGQNKAMSDDMDRRQEEIKRQIKNDKEKVDKDLEYLNRRLTDEAIINRQEHLILSEKMGRANGSTNNYYGNIGQQIGSAQEVSYHGSQTKI